MRQGKRLKKYKLKHEYEFCYNRQREIEAQNLKPEIMEAKKKFFKDFKDQLKWMWDIGKLRYWLFNIERK